MDNKIKEIFEIVNEFLKIQSLINYEKPFLDYLEKEIDLLGYKTLRDKNNYLVVKGNGNKNAKNGQENL